MGDAQLQQFLAVTDAPEAAARFFLESSGGDVAAAVDAYFRHGRAASRGGAPRPAHRHWYTMRLPWPAALILSHR